MKNIQRPLRIGHFDEIFDMPKGIKVRVLSDHEAALLHGKISTQDQEPTDPLARLQWRAGYRRDPVTGKLIKRSFIQ